MRDLHVEESPMIAVGKKQACHLEGFNEMQKRLTAVNVQDRRLLKYFLYTSSYFQRTIVRPHTYRKPRL